MPGDINSQNAVLQDRARIREEVMRLAEGSCIVGKEVKVLVSRSSVLAIIRNEVEGED